MGKLNNKWVRGAIPALLIHCSIGSVYAWSLFVNPLSNHLGISTNQVQFAFSLAIFFLGMSSAFFGKIVETNIKKSALISTICFCSGLMVTAIAVHFKSILGIYIGYGCLMGIGLGVGYITPVKTLMLWFKENKGFATGIAIMGFGFASAIASPIITKLINTYSLTTSFCILSAIYFLPMLLASILLKKPCKEQIEGQEQFKYKTILKDKNFIKIWFTVFINISCGLALISIASPLLVEMKLSLISISLVVGIMGIFNGCGRLIFSSISDKLKQRKTIYKAIFLISIFTTFIAFILKDVGVIIVTLIIISSTYGAGFSCLPSLLSEHYGMNNISTIHGLCLTAWAMAGLIGNQISAVIHSATNSYHYIFIVIGIMYVIGMLLTNSINTKNIRE